MPSWISRELSPFAVFATILVVLGIIGVVIIVSVTGMEPPDIGTVLPFPKSQLDYYLLDEIAGHLHHPDYRKTVDWPEHPDGEFEMATNNLGFREDSPTSISKPPGVTRILVTGDSHTDGVVANSESFANVLEEILLRREDGGVEVINAGHGHYGPENYTGLLRRWRELDPDRYIVVFFVGNDFMDAVADAWFRGEVDLDERPDGYTDRLEEAQRLCGAAVAQGLNQVFLFETFPDLAERALSIAVGHFEEIADLCAETGIEPSVVLLPAKINVAGETDPAAAAAVQTLGLDSTALDLNRRLAAELAAQLTDLGIDVLDLHDAFDASRETLFWVSDHHLNVNGHRLAAELFADRRNATRPAIGQASDGGTGRQPR
jgi:hypothetical protein